MGTLFSAAHKLSKQGVKVRALISFFFINGELPKISAYFEKLREYSDAVQRTFKNVNSFIVIIWSVFIEFNVLKVCPF